MVRVFKPLLRVRMNVALLDMCSPTDNSLYSLHGDSNTSVGCLWKEFATSELLVVTSSPNALCFFAARDGGAWIDTSALHSSKLARFCREENALKPTDSIRSALGESLDPEKIHLLIQIQRDQVPLSFPSVRDMRRVKILPEPEAVPSFTTAEYKTNHAMLKPVEIQNRQLMSFFNAEFPKKIHFRYEDVQVWKIMWEYATGQSDQPPLSVVGSGGVGKSTLARFLAVKVWAALKRDVMYVRCEPGRYASRFLGIDGKCIRGGNVYRNNYNDFVKRIECAEGREIAPLVILDGFGSEDLGEFPSNNVVIFSDVFHSSQDALPLLLPTWNLAQIRVLVSGLGVPRDEARNRYRMFGSHLDAVLNEDRVDGYKEFLRLNLDRALHHYGLGVERSGAIGLLHRYGLQDPTNPAHYRDPLLWVPTIDSAYIRQQIRAYTEKNFLDRKLLAVQVAQKSPMDTGAMDIQSDSCWQDQLRPKRILDVGYVYSTSPEHTDLPPFENIVIWGDHKLELPDKKSLKRANVLLSKLAATSLTPHLLDNEPFKDAVDRVVEASLAKDGEYVENGVICYLKYMNRDKPMSIDIEAIEHLDSIATKSAGSQATAPTRLLILVARTGKFDADAIQHTQLPSTFPTVTASFPTIRL